MFSFVVKIPKHLRLPGTIMPIILPQLSSITRSMMRPSNLPSITLMTSFFLNSLKDDSKIYPTRLYKYYMIIRKILLLFAKNNKSDKVNKTKILKKFTKTKNCDILKKNFWEEIL